MKKILKKNWLILATAIATSTAFFACVDEWKGEQYTKYVSFVRSGYVETYLNANAADGVVHYKIPIEICGSTENETDVTVTIALDKDTLDEYNQTMYFSRADKYYKLLDESFYNLKSYTITIPKGEHVGYIDIDFIDINKLDLVDKYILPFTISETSAYMPHPRMHYKKTLMRIIPFNDFTGNYSGGAGMIRGKMDDNTSTPSASVAEREMRFVASDEVFFYAGLTEEDARDRATYKIKAKFVPSAISTDTGMVVLTADSATVINFSYEPSKCTYTITYKWDELQPYLLIRTLIMNLSYQYDDVSNLPHYRITYKFGGTREVDPGSYTLERRRNTQIPEEDQQEVFD